MTRYCRKPRRRKAGEVRTWMRCHVAAGLPWSDRGAYWGSVR